MPQTERRQGFAGIRGFRFFETAGLKTALPVDSVDGRIWYIRAASVLCSSDDGGDNVFVAGSAGAAMDRDKVLKVVRDSVVPEGRVLTDPRTGACQADQDGGFSITGRCCCPMIRASPNRSSQTVTARAASSGKAVVRDHGISAQRARNRCPARLL